jgi:hypothetical protein
LTHVPRDGILGGRNDQSTLSIFGSFTAYFEACPLASNFAGLVSSFGCGWIFGIEFV